MQGLLRSKYSIPHLSKSVVVRTQLLERLEQSNDKRLIVVSAPAGFGKTTLLYQWLHDSTRAVAWLSLDRNDNDVQNFLSYLISAFQQIEPQFASKLLPALQNPQINPTNLGMQLIHELDTISKPFLLVLDDYHLIEAAAIGEIVQTILKHAPAQLQLVIAAREDPDLRLARMRANGDLLELRAADLRFNQQEAAVLLQEIAKQPLAQKEVEQLTARTEGWAAGLQLAGIALENHPDSAGFVASFSGSNRFILDYLLEEVLLHLSEEQLQFLLRISLVDRICGPLCEALTGLEPGKGRLFLHELERANLFIIGLDQERNWYRFHHLFAELLQQRLVQSLTADEVGQIHLAASHWFEGQALEFEAFQHTIAANDIPRSIELLEGKGVPLYFRGGHSRVMSWLERLEPSVFAAYPQLHVHYASTLLTKGDFPKVERELDAAEQGLPSKTDDPLLRDLLGHIAASRATVAITKHDLASIVAQADRALQLLAPTNLAVRTSTYWMLGYAHQFQHRRLEAHKSYQTALDMSLAIKHNIMSITSSIGLGRLYASSMQYELAHQHFQQAIAIGGLDMPIISEALIGLARLAYDQNELEQARTYAQQALPLAQQFEQNDRVLMSELFLAKLTCAGPDLKQAKKQLGQLTQRASQTPFAELKVELAWLQVQLALAQGDLTRAAQQAQPDSLGQIRVLIAQGQAQRALKSIERYQSGLGAEGWEAERFHSLLLQALAEYELGKPEAVSYALQEAFHLAENAHVTRSFLDLGESMRRVLHSVQHEALLAPTIQSLLQAFPASIPQSPDLIEGLTQRELSILRLIAAGHSNQQISQELVLALSTVKGHIRNLFDKLHVERRTEAVARARELKLL
jgi:LuxR family maltose regulon positive regulatory protein